MSVWVCDEKFASVWDCDGAHGVIGFAKPRAPSEWESLCVGGVHFLFSWVAWKPLLSMFMILSALLLRWPRFKNPKETESESSVEVAVACYFTLGATWTRSFLVPGICSRRVNICLRTSPEPGCTFGIRGPC